MTNLKRIRTASNITQAQLAMKSGVNLRMIQDYEQGQKPLNKAAAETVHKLAVALNTTVEQLLEEDGTMTRAEKKELLEKATRCLVADGINSALIDRMTDDEILHSYGIEDYDDYNKYMDYMAHKYDI
jgi:transcriptional regulator with XRE-family HTH domain